MEQLALKWEFEPVINLQKFNAIISNLKASLGRVGEGTKIIDDKVLTDAFKKVESQAGKTSNAIKEDSRKALADIDKQLAAIKSKMAFSAKLGVDDSELRKKQQQLQNQKIKIEAEIEPGDSFDNFTQQTNKFFGNNFVDQFAKFSLISDGIMNLGRSMASLTQPFLELDTATNRIKTLQGAAKELAPTLREMNLEMSKKYPIGAAALQTATYDALSAGINATEEDMSAFMTAASKLAVGGQEEIGNTVNLLSSMVNAYGESAQKTAEYSDILFTTVNLGKTTIPELTTSLSQVVPTAAAMGFSLKDVGASLAVMTANGIRTNQATTRLNQLLIEIQKPSTTLQAAFDGIGISAASLGEKIKSGDSIGAFRDMSAAFEKAGISATQAFSSVEASAAFNVLTKDFGRLEETMSGFTDAAGTTDRAFEDMSNSMENRIAQLRSGFESAAIKMADSLGVFGELGILGAQSLDQMTPYITSIAGLGTIFTSLGPQIAKFSTALVTKLVPGLIVTEGAQKRLNLAVLANPYVIAAAAIMGLVVGVKLLGDALHKTASERLDDMEGEKSAMDAQIQATEKQRDLVKGKLDLVAAFEKEGEAAMQNANLLLQLSQAYPGVIDRSKTYEENLKALQAQAGQTGGELNKLNSDLVNLGQKKIELNIQLDKQKLAVQKEEIEDTLTDAYENWTWGIGDKIADSIFGTSFNRKAAEQTVQSYADEIARASNSTELRDAGSKFQMAIFNADEFKGLSPEIQQKLLKQIDGMVEQQGKIIDARQKEATSSALILADQIGRGIIKEEEATKLLTAQFKITNEEAKKLLDTQKQNTAEAKATATAAEDISQAYKKATDEASKGFEGAADKVRSLQLEINNLQDKLAGKTPLAAGETIEQLRVDLNKAKKELEDANNEAIGYNKKMQDLSKINEKFMRQFEKPAKRPSRQINQVYDENEKTLKERDQKFLELQLQLIDDDYEKQYTELEAKNKQKIDDYNIRIAKYDEQIAKSSNKQQKEDLKRAKENLEDARAAELAIQEKSYEDLYRALAQSKATQITESTNKEIEALKNRKVLIEQTLAESNTFITASTNLADLKTTNIELIQKEAEVQIEAILMQQEEYQKLNAELMKLELRKKAGEKVDLTEVKNNLEKFKSEFINSNTKILAITNNTNRKVAEENYQYSLKLKENEIKYTENVEQQKRDKELFEAEKTYQERMKKADGYQAEEMQAWMEFQAEKSRIERDYILSNASVIAQSSISIIDNLNKSFAALDFTADDTAKKESLKRIDDEEKALNNSLQNRETSYEDYVNKIRDLDRQRSEVTVNTTKQLTDVMLQTISKSLDDTIKQYNEKLSAYITDYNAYRNKEVDIDNRINEITRQIGEAAAAGDKEREEQLTALRMDLTKERGDAVINSERIIQSAYTETAMIAGMQFAKMVADGKNATKAMVLSALSAAKALVPVLVVEILGKEFATKGLVGIATAGVLTALLTAALSTAEAAVSNAKFRRGAINIQGPGTETSDSIPARISKGESVISAKTTRLNLKELQYIYKNQSNVFQYYKDHEPERIKEAYYSIADAKDLVKFAPVLNVMVKDKIKEKNNNEAMLKMRKELRAMNMKLDELAKLKDINEAIEKGNYIRRDYATVDVNLELNDAELLTRADKRKLSSLRKL